MPIKCVLWFLLKTTEGTHIFETQLGFGLDEQVFIRHIQSRWFTLIPAMNNSQADQKQCFFKDLLKVAKINPGRQWEVQNDYRKLKGPVVRVQLCFLQSLESIFDRVPDSFRKSLRVGHSFTFTFPWSAVWTSVHFDAMFSQSRWSRKEQESSCFQSMPAKSENKLFDQNAYGQCRKEGRWRMSRKRPNYGDDEALSNCYKVFVQ